MNNRKIPITTDNYELFAIDYADGRLSKEEAKALFAFFDAHPCLKEHFEMFLDSEPLEAEELRFPFPDRLKHSFVTPLGAIDATNYHNYFIAWWEGDLREADKANVLSFLHLNPHLQQEFALFERLRIAPDTEVSFPYKNKLKKRAVYKRYLYPVGVVVAAIFLAALFFFCDNQFVIKIPAEDAAPMVVKTPDVTEKDIQGKSVEPIPVDRSIAKEETCAELSLQQLPEKQEARGEEKREALELITAVAVREATIIPVEEPPLVLQQPLKAQRIFIKEIEPDEFKLLAQGQELPEPAPEPKRRLWNFLSWSAKQYSQITGEQVTIMQVEDIEADKVSYQIEL